MFANKSVRIAAVAAVAATVAAAAVGFALAQKEYKSGIVWPEPKVVTPGEKPSDPPSDAVVLFDGKDLSKWANGDKWKLEDGYAVVQKSDITTKEAQSISPHSLSGREQYKCSARAYNSSDNGNTSTLGSASSACNRLTAAAR